MDQSREYVGFIPGDGWMLTHHESDQTWSQRIIAWAFDKNGDGHPITTTDDGEASVVKSSRHYQISVWHPDLAPPAFDGMDVVGRRDWQQKD